MSKFREYASVKHDISVKESVKFPFDAPYHPDNLDELLSLVFAPDPDTGYPRSDLATILSADSNPQLAQYIRDNLMRSLPDGVSVPDADFAIASIPLKGESLVDYSNRLKSLVTDSVSS